LTFKILFLYGTGNPCNICKKKHKKRKRRTTEEFVRRARLIHGGKYDYSMSNYTGSTNKLLIRCSTHGFFSQPAGGHLKGRGCPECSIDKQRSKAKRSPEEIIKRRKHKKHRHRARKYNCYYEPVSRESVFKRDNYRCKECGEKVQTETIYDDNSGQLGHIIPLSLGGEHSYSNVQCECRKCNMKKRNTVENKQISLFCKT